MQRKLTFTLVHTPMTQHREQIGVQCLAQGHIDMQRRGAENQTANLLVGGRLLYLLSLQVQVESKATGLSIGS